MRSLLAFPPRASGASPPPPRPARAARSPERALGERRRGVGETSAFRSVALAAARSAATSRSRVRSAEQRAPRGLSRWRRQLVGGLHALDGPAAGQPLEHAEQALAHARGRPRTRRPGPRPGCRPPGPRAGAPRRALEPSRFSRCSASEAQGQGSEAQSWQRERIVGSSACGDDVTRKTCDVAGGSSRLLSSAFCACSVMLWASSMTNARARPSKGRPQHLPHELSRTCSILMARAPGLDQEQVGVQAEVAQRGLALVLDLAPHLLERVGGALRAQAGRAASAGVAGSPSHSRARAAARASVFLPTPCGPGEAAGPGGSRPVAQRAGQQRLDALVAEDARRRPRLSLQTWAAGPAPRPPPAPARRPPRRSPVAVDDDPAPRVLRPSASRSPRAPARGTRAPPPPGGRRSPRLPTRGEADLDRHVEKDREVGPQAAGRDRGQRS